MPKFENLVRRRRSVKIRVAACQPVEADPGFEATTGSRVSWCHILDLFLFSWFLCGNRRCRRGSLLPWQLSRPTVGGWVDNAKTSWKNLRSLDVKEEASGLWNWWHTSDPDTLSRLFEKIPGFKISTEEEILTWRVSWRDLSCGNL